MGFFSPLLLPSYKTACSTCFSSPLAPIQTAQITGKMAVTHADLSVERRRSDVGGKMGVLLIVFAILCGLSCFLLCLIAEATRSESTWVLLGGGKDGQRYECVYSGSGMTPLFCALGAFVTLAVGMVMKHVYILIAVSRPTPPALLVWTPDSTISRSLTWQACLFFVTTWICFAVGEVLLMIGIGVESSHLRRWSRPRPNCLIVRQGLFAAAGVFGLATVILAGGLYLTALHAESLRQEEEHARREMMEVSYLYSSPVRSPIYQIRASSQGGNGTSQTCHSNSQLDKPSNSILW